MYGALPRCPQCGGGTLKVVYSQKATPSPRPPSPSLALLAISRSPSPPLALPTIPRSSTPSLPTLATPHPPPSPSRAKQCCTHSTLHSHSLVMMGLASTHAPATSMMTFSSAAHTKRIRQNGFPGRSLTTERGGFPSCHHSRSEEIVLLLVDSDLRLVCEFQSIFVLE